MEISSNWSHVHGVPAAGKAIIYELQVRACLLIFQIDRHVLVIAFWHDAMSILLPES